MVVANSRPKHRRTCAAWSAATADTANSRARTARHRLATGQSALLSPAYRATTLSLWATYFMGLLVIYLLSGWLPTMIKDAGLPIERAANLTALFQLGGTVGALLVGYLMDRWTPNKVIALQPIIGGAVFILCLASGSVQSIHVRRLRAAGRLLHERRPDRLERLRPGLLPDRRARHGRQLDAGHGPLRQHLRLLRRRRAAVDGLGLQLGDRGPGDSGRAGG
jgi:hypothetical protein